jgi:hypothetical protein
VNAGRLREFASLIMANAKADQTPEWFEHCSFVHISKPSPAYHNNFSVDARSQFLAAHLKQEKLSLIDMGQDEAAGGRWFLDVGLRIAHQELSVAWVDQHLEVVRRLFGVEYDRHDDTQYRREIVSHMTEVTCGRIYLHRSDTRPLDPSHPTYIELSVNDRVLEVLDDRGEPVRFMTAADLIRCPRGTEPTLTRMARMYAFSSDFKITATILGRMPIGAAMNALADIPSYTPILLTSCVTFKSWVLW